MIGRLAGGVDRWLPGLRALREYRRSWLANDLVAGLVLTALLVPVGMGYAQAAGLPPITGLYATIVPLVVYAVFGPSRVMVLGPDSSLAAVIAAVILPLGGRDPETAVALAGALAVLTGLIILVAGIARLGFMTELLSRPVQLGYLSGIAVTILVGQLPRLCGFSVDGRGLLSETRDVVQGVAGGQVNRAALAVGLAGIVVVLVLRRFWRTFPGVMAAVVLGIVAVSAFDLTEQGVEVIGVLPKGLPTLALPAVELADLGALFSGALGIALVAVADTTVLSQSLAAQRNESVDPNQELRALGAANLAAGLFQGFAISSSASRTPVAVSAGARSQLTPLVGAATIALMLLFAPGALRDLPLPMLAAIVITAAVGLIDVAAVRRLYRVRRLVAEATHPVRWVVVAAEPITDVDTTAADTLFELLVELRQEQVTLAFAELKGPVKDRFERYGLFAAVGSERFFPTVGTAVDGYIAASGVEWVDWEERPEARPTP
jgi:MFS superfamily sulfate permease-like transporter